MMPEVVLAGDFNTNGGPYINLAKEIKDHHAHLVISDKTNNKSKTLITRDYSPLSPVLSTRKSTCISTWISL